VFGSAAAEIISRNRLPFLCLSELAIVRNRAAHLSSPLLAAPTCQGRRSTVYHLSITLLCSSIALQTWSSSESVEYREYFGNLLDPRAIFQLLAGIVIAIAPQNGYRRGEGGQREGEKVNIAVLRFSSYVYVCKRFYSIDMPSSFESICNGQRASQT